MGKLTETPTAASPAGTGGRRDRERNYARPADGPLRGGAGYYAQGFPIQRLRLTVVFGSGSFQLLTYIILAAAAISTEVVYLAYKGETCGSFSGFCRKATASIAITFLVTLCYVALSLISSYSLFTNYDAPIAYKPIQVSAFNPA